METRSKSKMATNKELPITDQPVSDIQVDLSKDLKTISDQMKMMQFQIQKADNEGAKGLNTQFCPEMFFGMPSEDTNDWIEKFIAWSKFNGLKDMDRVHNAIQLRLSGSALTWFKTVAPQSNFDNLSKLFKDHFAQNRPSWLLEQQLAERNMSKDENIEIYIMDIDRRCNILAKSEKEKIAALMRGLHPTIRMFVMQQNPKTWVEAVQAARLSADSISAIPSQSKELSEMMAVIRDQSAAILDLKRQMDTAEAKVCATTSAKSDVTCQLCNKKGHAARECYTLRSRDQGARRKELRKCYNCGKQGHLKRDCLN